MGLDVKRFQGHVDVELLCPICTDVLESPKQTPCEHAFCEACIKHWLDSVRNTCPSDQRRLSVGDLQEPSRLLLNFLGKLEISCDFADKGCQVFTRLDLHAGHVKDCKARLVTCDKECGLEIPYDEIKDHSCVKYMRIRVENQDKKISEFERAAGENKNLLNDCQSLIRDYQGQLWDCQDQLRDCLGQMSDLKSQLKDCKKQLEACKTSLGLANQPFGLVYFQAFRNQEFTVPKKQKSFHVLTYDRKVTSSPGFSMDTTGIFKAPKAGVYTFSCQGTTPLHKVCNIILLHNGKEVARAVNGSTNVGTQISVLALIKLTKGDQVWVGVFGGLTSDIGTQICFQGMQVATN